MQQQGSKPNFEFIALMASLMSIAALAIDALIPALSQIGIAIQNTDPTKHQLLIVMIFLGLGSGQLFFGPLSDTLGRKSVVYIGFLLFALASLVCVFASSLEWMVIGRICQGIGLSAPRTVSISIIRDTYSGNYMARVMSFVTAFFILVPVIAPAIGKLILDTMGWQAIFYLQLFFTLVVGIWFWKRQTETLKPNYKIPFTLSTFKSGIIEVSRHPETIVCTIISGLITGSFLVYLSTAQHVFEIQYALKDSFTYVFAGLASAIGIATFFNGTLVIRYGMRNLAQTALAIFVVVSSSYTIIYWRTDNPELFIVLLFLALLFLCLGFIWGNMRSIAMQPLGHIAGIGAAITGCISTVLSIPISLFIGSFVTTTILPLFIGFGICSGLAFILFSVFRTSGQTDVDSV